MTSYEQPWLENLNSVQRQAVESPAKGSLQILAGPGSGKTRVLTCRVAYLIKNTGIDPQDLAVVTFTNKAANEMKNRLYVLLGAKLANEIVMGTFHGVCVRFLRKHGSKVGLKANWVICDRKQQLTYCKDLLKDPKVKAQMARSVMAKFTDESLLDYISKRKSKGEAFEASQKIKKDSFVNDLFHAYNSALADDNCLDFDDLLTYGERLFRCHPQVISYIRHVLIDEFQDTNVVQYQMMRHMAHRGAVTIVGDPDQGIYGWRSAEVGNLMRMREDLPRTMRICLEENYRSSSLILKASLSVVQQDTQRIDKSLFTSHPKVSLPVLQTFRKPPDESEFIAREIQRLVAHTGGQLNFNDFSILLRYGSISRNVEAALQTAGIPTRMVGGFKFFDRVEVKEIIAYLQLADNPMFVPAFEKIVNVPSRAIGKITVKAVKEAAKSSGSNPMEIMRRLVRGETFPGLSQTHKSKFNKFLCVIAKIQSMARLGCSIVEIIDTLIEQVNYTAHLEQNFPADSVDRLQNVEELKSFAIHLEGGSSPSNSQPTQSGEDADIQILNPRVLGDNEGVLADLKIEPINLDEEPTALRRFLTESMLSTDTEAEESKATKNLPKVTISTCHASKGLEWPVVFVPAVEDGIFPFYRCNDEESQREERRLLFVAMTRAQGLLYLSHCRQRMAGAETRNQSISPFVSSLATQTTKSKSSNNAVFTSKRPILDETVRQELSDVLGRPMPPEHDVSTSIEKYQRIAGVVDHTLDLNDADNSQSNYAFQDPNYNRWGSGSISSGAASYNGVGSQNQSSSAGRFSFSQPTPTIKPYGFNRPGSQAPSVAAGKFVSTQPNSAMPGFSSAYILHASQTGATTNSDTKKNVPVLKSYGFNRPGSRAPPAPKTGASGVSSATADGKKNISAPFIPQIPRKPLAPSTEAIQNLPETRLSRGSKAAVTLDLTVSSPIDPEVGSTEVSLASFQASSSSFMNGLKHILPQDSNSVVVNKKQKKLVATKAVGASTSQKKPAKKGKGESKA
ncbi:P-loop containing nucleoside triphosphate hydrolase protein [Melampsora americana]|nr:P-loop containing nucleoside triphosphate hydrolase protein [Melampsora americana]